MSDTNARLAAALSDRYRIEREFGAGGMATVYLAYDVKHDRKVALKVLKPELAAVVGSERFLAEIKTTANLQHPHILPLFDSGEADGFLFFVMPYVEGESLCDRLDREKQLPVDEALRIAVEVADALAHAHTKGVIHRDIKPANILLRDGRVQVADFGIALAVQQAGGARLTETGLSVGTPHYMSPEQASGDRQLDGRSDVYSLGCVLYEMLAGEPPHTGATAQSILAKILTEEPRPLSQLRRRVPPHVEVAVHAALEKLPADRFDTAAGLASALRDPSSVGIRARHQTPRGQERYWLVRTLAVTLALVLVVAVMGWLRRIPREVVRASIALHEAPLTDQPRLRIAISPDGRRVVYVGPSANNTLERQLWLRELDALDARALPGTEGAIAPFFSRDGSSIGFFTDEQPGDLRLVPAGGGPVRTVVAGGTDPWGGDWGPDGRIYFTGHDGHLLRVFPGETAIDTVVGPDYREGEVEYDFAQVLPNGKGVIVQVWRSSMYDSEIAVVSLETGGVKTLMPGMNARYLPTGHLVWVIADGSLLAAPFDPDRLELRAPSTLIEQGIIDADAGVAQYAVSESGHLVYEGASASRVAQLQWVSRQGQSIPIDANWWGEFRHAALSPDGKYVALTLTGSEGTHLWVRDLEAGSLLRLARVTSYDRPTWTVDGMSVTYWGEVASDRGIWVRRADASQPATHLVGSSGGYAAEAVWSPDGKSLLLSAERPGTLRDILVMRPGIDTVPRPLISDSRDQYSPTFSPNGRWVAYTSNESGQPEVYVRPFDDPDRARWPVSVDGGTEPVWARGDGREIFFRSGNGALIRRAWTETPDFTLGPGEVLFDASRFRADPVKRAYDISPNGDRFLMVRQGLVSELILVTNWFEELTAKLAR